MSTKDTDHGKKNSSTNIDDNIITNNVDKGEDDTVTNKMDQIILTEESFLQFIDKEFDEDSESNEKSLVNNSTETVVGEDSIGSTASTSK